MYKEDDDTALLALRGGLRGRFRRSLDSMENAFEALQDSLERTTSPAQRAELQPIFDELCTQLLSLRRLGDQTSDAATAALLRGSCTPRPMDLVSQLREICDILQEEAARCGLPFTVELCCAGVEFLPTMGDATLLNGLVTNLVSNTLAVDGAAHIVLHCAPGCFVYRDNGPGLPPDARALLTEEKWSERLLHAGGLGLPLIAAYARAMDWALAVGEGPGTELQFTLPAPPPLENLMLESPAERMAEQRTRRQLIQRELALLANR